MLALNSSKRITPLPMKKKRAQDSLFMFSLTYVNKIQALNLQFTSVNFFPSLCLLFLNVNPKVFI